DEYMRRHSTGPVRNFAEEITAQQACEWFFGMQLRLGKSERWQMDMPRELSEATTGTKSGIDPAVVAILDEARSQEAQVMEPLPESQRNQARTRRAETAWRRVASFRGDANPHGLTGKALWPRYAELIVDLGRVLLEDGWQDAVSAIQAGSPAKQCA